MPLLFSFAFPDDKSCLTLLYFHSFYWVSCLFSFCSVFEASYSLIVVLLELFVIFFNAIGLSEINFTNIFFPTGGLS